MITNSCTIRHFFVHPREIYFLRFILEGYDGLAVVTTLQPKAGLVQISVAPGCEEDLERILADEKSRLGLRAATV